VLTAALVITATSCHRDSKATRDEPTAKILVVGRSADDPMWATACRLAEISRQTRGWVGVEMRVPKEGTPDAQRELLEDLKPSDWRAICILVNDPEAIASQVERLVRSGLPVVLLGRDARASGRTMFCGVDEEEIGEAAANACIQGLAGDQATIGLVHGGEQDPTSRARLRGFRRRISTTRGIEIIREFDCSGREVEARRFVMEEATKYPRIGAWVMLDDWVIRSAPDDARVAGPQTLIVFFTPDAQYLAAVPQGAADAAIGIDYEQIIERGLTLASELARGGKMQLDTETVHPIVLTRKTPPAELARRLGLPTATAVSTRP
jgi:ABC-type sugar transport system substrate-binding protein